MSVSPAHLVRLHSASSYCTGTLVAPDVVLTCGHFFIPLLAKLRSVMCSVGEERRRIDELYLFPGTDIALVTLTKPVVLGDFPTIGPPPSLLSQTVTFGFGGGARTPNARAGRYLTPLPLAVSRAGYTRVRPAGLVLSGAIKGDSGGPIVAKGRIFAVQSLILAPYGRNLRLATVALVSPRVVDKLEALKRR